MVNMIPKILCNVPDYDGAKSHPLMSLLLFATHAGEQQAAGKYKIRWNIGGRARLNKVRNLACNFSLQGQASHLFLIYNDMVMPSETLDRLLELDLPIVAPIFFRAGESRDPLVFRVGSNGYPEIMRNYPVDTVFEALVGAGVMLIKTEVLQALDYPWFYYPEDPGWPGTDLKFCQRANAAGFKSYCDSRILVEQMDEPKPVGRNEWQLRRNMAKEKQPEFITSCGPVPTKGSPADEGIAPFVPEDFSKPPFPKEFEYPLRHEEPECHKG